ncbi:MAG: hypothetical protein E7059_01925 [Treponema bryantii]|nr:hypothetical protein [Treponema bryantii]
MKAMKNFFDKSNWKIKLLLHVIMFIFILVVIPLVSSSFETSIGYFIWFLTVIIEVCFIILSVRSFIKHIGEEKTINKQIEKTEEILNNNEKEYSSEIKNQNLYEKEDKIIETSYELPNLILDNDLKLKIKYRYREKLCFCENLDSIKVLSRIGFKQEVENVYDKETIVAFFDDKKIGLLYKGNCRDILNKSLGTQKDDFLAFVKRIDLENNFAELIIGFYEPINFNNVIEAKLLKTNKIDYYTDEKRQEQVELLSENDIVTLKEDIENECLIVESDIGNELGELSASVSKKILDRSNYICNVYAYVSKLEYDIGSEKTKVTLKIVF